MSEREDRRENRSRERSPFTAGGGAHAGAGRLLPSLRPVGGGLDPEREDPVTRHRLARARREAEAGGVATVPQGGHQEEPAEEAGIAAEEGPAYDGEEDLRWRPLIDPVKVIAGIARSKKLIAAATVAGALLGVAIAISIPKKYEATTELIADPRNLQITDHDLTQPGIASDATLAIVENQVRVLTSGTVLDQVATKLNLFQDPEFNGQGQGFPGVMALVRSLFSGDDAPGAGGEERRHAIVIRNLAESLTVERGSKTFVISIGARSESGEKSALIANTMADIFLQTYGQLQSDTASRATGELTGRLDELRKEVEEAERNLETFKAEHDLIDAQGRLISDDELLKLNEQLTVARARTLELNAKAASARGISVDSVVAGTLPEEISSDAMNDLRSQYAKLKQDADKADAQLGPRHPQRLALEAQLAGARSRIAGELRRIASSLQTELKRAVQLEQELSSRLAQLKVRSGDVNSDLVTARELERKASTRRAVYESYLLRAKQTGEQQSINTANISVISKAYPPLDPAGPSRALISLLGLLLGFASGVGFGAVRGAYESLRETADRRARPMPSAARRAAPADPSAYGPFAFGEPASVETPSASVRARGNPMEALRAAIGNTFHRSPRPQDVGVEGRDEAHEESRSGAGDGDPGDSTKQTESPMHPFYRDPNAPFGWQQPAGYPQPQFQQGVYAQPLYPQPSPYFGAPAMMPQPMAYSTPVLHPQPYAPPLPYAYPQPQPWAMHAPAAAAFPHGQPPAPPAPPMAYAPAPVSRPQPAETPVVAEDTTPIEEVRASLREFRDAVRELTESRARRRYF